MPHTEHFVIDSKTKSLKPIAENPRAYWQGDKKGTIDGEIEVFAYHNHKVEAQKIQKILEANGMAENYFSIKISVKQ